MTVQTRFVMPEDDAADAEKWRALDVLSAVPMTIDQLERGNELHRRCLHEAMVEAYKAKAVPEPGHSPDDLAFAELERFCESEGLHPTDVAAHAMLMRYAWVDDATAGCVDLKADYPETYAGLVVGPIDPLCMTFEDYDCRPEAERHGCNAQPPLL